MAYVIKKIKTGFKVCKKDDPKKCFSKKGLPLKKAKKQKIAIILSEKGLIKGRGAFFEDLAQTMINDPKMKKVLDDAIKEKNKNK